ncbi:type I CRISPR-associated protein Cas7 [Methylomicrobium lacus]|uniref:type I CRISPR-associated protein Cas7 n=1 Tax=Methylomicrobium lacus TaxID=136992 RepID=UPI0035A84BA5
MSQNNQMLRATGLLIIEVINSNPNGDPDRESDPRQRHDFKGEISPVSFKRKLRDLIADKEGVVWLALQQELQLEQEKFYILETRGRDRKQIESELKDEGKAFKEKYWDGRVFGNTFLESGSSTTIKTGVVQFGLGVSVAPVDIERHTNTNMSGVQEGKDRGMAPMGYRFVPHGVYCMPFFVNPSQAHKTGCTVQDIDLMKRVIAYAYAHTRSHARPSVELRHAWYIEHNNPLGSCSDLALLDSLRPTKKTNANEASTSWEDYDVPTALPENLQAKVKPLIDLIG